jgi:site-specific DNA-methyltransferase (adenine-specific)
MPRRPGEVRDAILAVFAKSHNEDVSTLEIRNVLRDSIGEVPSSSIRSCLRLNTPVIFERIGRGRYKLTDSKS